MPSLEELWPALVRSVACSGDSREGCVFFELGAGPLSGATVVVRYDGGGVSVHLSSGSRSDLEVWCERIARRLRARGLAVAEVEQI